MPAQFSFDPTFLAVSLLVPIGIIIVIWIALRKYLETRKIGFLTVALAFILPMTALQLIGLVMRTLFKEFRVAVWFYTGVIVLSLILIAYGLLRFNSESRRSMQLSFGEKLNLSRQLSLLAGVTMIIAAFTPWVMYSYTYRTPTTGVGRGGGFSLLDVFLLPSMLELEQINIDTLVIGATLAGILLLVAGLGCIVKNAKWSVLSVAGLIAFFFAYAGFPGANLVVATGITSGANYPVFTEVLDMALSSGFILGTLGLAIGLAALILSIAAARAVRITHMNEKPNV